MIENLPTKVKVLFVILFVLFLIIGIITIDVLVILGTRYDINLEDIKDDEFEELKNVLHKDEGSIDDKCIMKGGGKDED